MDTGGQTPWVLAPDATARLSASACKIGVRDDRAERIEILAGVAAGDVLLIGAARAVTPGTPVTVTRAAAVPDGRRRGSVMFISDFAIRKPIITVVTMLALVVFGLAALLLLKTDEFPDVQPPIVVVSVLYPGAAPENVEREVIEPIEDVISGISGVSQIQSSALDSFAVFIVQFAYEKDLQEATQQIRDEVNAIRNDLPPEMEEPVLTRFDPADLPGGLARAGVDETLTGPELTLLADPGIVRRLRGLQGVAQATVVGGVERELTVELRPQALQAAGVGVAQVVGALQAQNLVGPGRPAAREPAMSAPFASAAGSPRPPISSDWSSRSRTAASSASATWRSSATAPRNRDRPRSSTAPKPSASKS